MSRKSEITDNARKLGLYHDDQKDDKGRVVHRFAYVADTCDPCWTHERDYGMCGRPAGTYPKVFRDSDGNVRPFQDSDKPLCARFDQIGKFAKYYVDVVGTKNAEDFITGVVFGRRVP